jgi:hypothetical protein
MPSRQPDGSQARIIPSLRIFLLVALLCVVASFAQRTIEQTRHCLLPKNCLYFRSSHPILTYSRRGYFADALLSPHATPLWLRLRARKSGGRLRLAIQAALDLGELRRVHRRHLNDTNIHFALVVPQFTSQRIGETNNCVLRCAVGGLERNASHRQRRPDLDDPSSITRHSAQSCLRAMNKPR